MALLPEEQRTAIILKEYHGLTFQEIADLRGLSVEHGKNATLSGADGIATRAGARGRVGGGALIDTPWLTFFAATPRIATKR